MRSITDERDGDAGDLKQGPLPDAPGRAPAHEPRGSHGPGGAPDGRGLLRPGWIVWALFALYPVWWALGFGEFVWGLAALPLATWALRRRRLRRPPAVLLFGIYVGWAACTVIRIDTGPRLLLFGLRYGVYLTSLGLAYYVYNERRVDRRTFIDWLALLWVWAIIGGYIGLAFPNGRLNQTLANIVLPRSLTRNDYVGMLVRPRFAQVRNYFGVDLPRPSTLFAYTNEWGGNVALLTPFFLAATLCSNDPRRRHAGIAGLIVGVPVMILSMNRGLWLSGGLILAVVAVRSFVAGRPGPLKATALAVGAVAAVVVLTPLGTVVSGRIEGGSEGARERSYAEAWAGAKASPILGWGGPRPSTDIFTPAVGTHGHLWFSLFAHGFVGAALYITFLTWAMFRVGFARDAVSIMLASVVFVGALQMFFYNMFSGSLPIILVALALVFRQTRPETAPRRFAAVTA